MRTGLMAVAALVMSGALTMAQTPQNPPQRPVDPATQRAAAGDQTLTIVGCLKEEKDVPGRRPSVAERAGISEDYVLTNVKMAPGSATSGIGLASMYEIEGIAEAELKKHVNHQVEIVGRLTARGAAAPATPPAGGADLPEFTATSLKMLSTTCTPPQ